MDCPGTRDVREYADSADDANVREACRICADPIPSNADLSFGFLGDDSNNEVLVTVGARFESELLQELSLTDKMGEWD